MKEKLIRLESTLNLVETRGESTIIMADCIKFVRQLITECNDEE